MVPGDGGRRSGRGHAATAPWYSASKASTPSTAPRSRERRASSCAKAPECGPSSRRGCCSSSSTCWNATGLRPLVSGYLGERPALTLKKSTLRRTHPLPFADWHQDGAFLGDGIRTINLWLSLSDCGVDAPGLDLLPRRLDRIVETGSGGAIFPWSVGPGTVEEAAEGVAVVRPRFKPGDALLFDEMFLHRTATDETMTRDRYAIESWFFAPSVYPGDQIPFVW